MADSHKTQHWVPRSYLNAWCDPNCPVYYVPYVHVFRRDGTPLGTRAPRNLFTENNLYTIQLEDGRRDLRLEHGLSTVEDEFARLRPKIERREVLSQEEAGWLLAFVAASQARTPAMREHQQRQFAELLRVTEHMQAHIDRMPPEELERATRSEVASGGVPADIEGLRRMVAAPLQELMLPMIAAQLRAFAHVNIKLGILYHDFDVGFVTSDLPCVWFDPEAANAPLPFRGAVGLASRTVEVTLPITPKHALILSHCEHLEGYVPLPDVALVHEMNRRTIAHCDKEFVSSQGNTHPVWFYGIARQIARQSPDEPRPQRGG